MASLSTYDSISKTLYNCDMSDTNCEKCLYKDLAPNECLKELHRNAFYLLRDTKELADYFHHSVMEKYEKEG